MTVTRQGVVGPGVEPGTGAASTTVNVPPGTQAGDLLVAFIRTRQGGSASAPGGWTRLLEGSNNNGGTGLSDAWAGIYTRTATASEPASYTWSPGGYPQGAMVAYRGAQVIASAVTPNNTATSGTHTGPAITPASNVTGAVVIQLCTCGFDADSVPAWANSITELWADDANAVRMMATEQTGIALTAGTPYTPGAVTHNRSIHKGVNFTLALADTPPPAPTGASSAPASDTTATITWAPVTGATGYEVRVNAGTPTAVGNVTSYTVTGLEPATTYTIDVRALNAGGGSAWVSTTTTTADPPPVPPSAPLLRLYERLPEHYRDADARLDYPLRRYLSLVADQLAPLDDLVERFDYDADTGGTSDLVDATTANARWLPWLAQLLGVRIAGLDVAAQRTRLTNPAAAWDHGTPGAIAEAAALGLTGTRTVTVTAHYGGDPYVIGLGTKDSETASPNTFAKLAAVAPRWADLGTWAKASAPSVLAAAEVERPAGYRMVRYSTGA